MRTQRSNERAVIRDAKQEPREYFAFRDGCNRVAEFGLGEKAAPQQHG